MSAAHTWFGRSITRLRSRYGNILWPGAGFVVRRFGPQRGDSHPAHQPLHPLATSRCCTYQLCTADLRFLR